MQLASKIGSISFEKSILWFAGGGNCAICSGVIVSARAGEQNRRKNHFAKRSIMRSIIYSKSKKITGGKGVATTRDGSISIYSNVARVLQGACLASVTEPIQGSSLCALPTQVGSQARQPRAG